MNECSGTLREGAGWHSRQVFAARLPSCSERMVWHAAQVMPRSACTSGSIFRYGSPSATGPR